MKVTLPAKVTLPFSKFLHFQWGSALKEFAPLWANIPSEVDRILKVWGVHGSKQEVTMLFPLGKTADKL